MSSVYTHIKQKLFMLKEIPFKRNDFNTLFSESLMPTTLIDRKGYILQVNKAFLKMTGKDREKIIYKKFYEIALEEDRDRIKNFIQKKGTGNEKEKFCGYKTIDSRGGLIDILLKKTTLSGSHRFLLFHFDLSNEITSHETALKENLLAQNATKEKNEFFRQISHELFNPLYEVIGSLGFINSENLSSNDSYNLETAKKGVMSLKKTIVELIEHKLDNLLTEKKQSKKIDLPDYNPNVINIETNPRVLIVEDNKICSKVTASMLKKTGCQTDTAEDGLKAIELTRKKKYDIIFMDINMPGIDGYETTGRIKKESLNFDTPIVALTAYNTPDDKRRAMIEGMKDFISKPASIERFREVVKKLTPCSFTNQQGAQNHNLINKESISVPSGP